MRDNDFPPLQLRAFEAVARLQSMSGAAREINLSQPGVTQLIEALEKQLQVRRIRQRSGCYTTVLGTDPAAARAGVLRPYPRRPGRARRSHPVASRQTEELAGKITGPSAQPARDLPKRIPSMPRPGRLSVSWHRAAWARARAAARPLPAHRARPHHQCAAPSWHGGSRSRSGTFTTASRSSKAAEATSSLAAGGRLPRIPIRKFCSAADINGSSAKACVRIVDGHYDMLLNRPARRPGSICSGVLRTPAWPGHVTEEAVPNPWWWPKRHPLTKLARITLSDLTGYDWITPGPGTPRQQALERMFGALNARRGSRSRPPRCRSIARASTERLSLMSLMEARLNDAASFAILPFRLLRPARTG